MWLRKAALLALALTVAGSLLACGDDDSDSSTEPTAGRTAAATSAPASTLSGDLTVFAAASLTDSFEEMKTAFEDANPDVSITYNFAGSPALRTQLQEGAAADIYAAADTTNMQQALEASLVVDAGQIFARNRLAIIVPAENPANIAAPADLAKDGLKLVLAQADVPVGRYARESLAKMSADPQFGATFTEEALANVVSEEPNVKAIVTKVQLGEADAGIVYVTDVTPDVSADIEMIEIPEVHNVIATYPIAMTADAANPEAAEGFIEFVLSAEGQAILVEHGLLPAE